MFGGNFVGASLQEIFEPVANLCDIEFPEPVPYTTSHPLPNIVRNFNTFMSRIAVVFARWAEAG